MNIGLRAYQYWHGLQTGKRLHQGLLRLLFALPFALGVGTALPAVDTAPMTTLIRSGNLKAITARLQIEGGEHALADRLGFQSLSELREGLKNPFLVGLLEQLCRQQNEKPGSGGQPHHNGSAAACHAWLDGRKHRPKPNEGGIA